MGRRFALSVLLFGLVGCGQSVTLPTPDKNGDKNRDLAASVACPAVIGDPALAGKPAFTTSHGQVMTRKAGKLNYTATAGYLPIYAAGTQSGAVQACLFYFAYTRADHIGDSQWPLTFLFNGGPGSASDWLHLGGMGPKKMNFGAEGITPTSSTLEDDTNTLLATSDLVFIDPISTGYSRAAKGVDATQYDGLQSDAASIGDFIRGYITANNRGASPKFVLGESYGGMRLPVLGRYLDEKLGIKLSGLIFISPWLDAAGDDVFGDRDASDDLPYLGYLPEYATVAWYHQKLDAAQEAKPLEQVFDEAETFANGEYLDALALGDDLPAAERAKVAAELTRLTSLPATTVADLRPSLEQFRTQVLGGTGETIAYYDGRMKAKVADPTQNDPFDAFDSFFAAADTSYFGTTLGVSTDLPYAGNDWTTWAGAPNLGGIAGGYFNVLDDINTLLTNNPQLKVYMANGLFDLVCPAAEDHFMVRHLKPEVAARFQIGHYPAGHPIYFGDISHQQFADEISSLYAAPAPTPASATVAVGE